MANDQFGNPDLSTALQMFTEGAKTLQLQRAIADANDQVQQVKSSELNQMKQRGALTDIANNVVSRMVGIGANPTQIAQIANSIKPEALPTSANEAVLQGTLTGNTDLAAAGNLTLDQANARELRLVKQKEEYAASAQNRLFDQQDKRDLRKENRDAMKPEKITPDMRKVAGFAARMQDADKIFGQLEKQGFDASSSSGVLAQYLPNSLQTADRQKLEQAQRAFVNADLRRESGAAISSDEFASAAKEYFPQPGDAASVVNQKKLARKRVIDNLRSEASSAARPTDIRSLDVPASSAGFAKPRIF